MSRAFNKRISFTISNQDGVRTAYDWIIILHFMICHLIAICAASKFVLCAIHNDEPITEGMVLMKMLMFVIVYVCSLTIVILITGFPAVANWAESKLKGKEYKIKLL